jgi:phosphate acetyltransferase
MKPLDNLITAAVASPCHIVLAEGEDARIVQAAIQAQTLGMAKITLVGQAQVVADRIRTAGASANDFTIADPATAPNASPYAGAFMSCANTKGSAPKTRPKPCYSP